MSRTEKYFLFLVFYLTESYCQDPVGCLSRDYGFGSTVCVCNSEHCDTIPPPQPVDSSKYLLYTSDKSGLRFKQQIGDFKHPILALNKIRLNRHQTYQSILGFGGAFTDAAGVNINSLPEPAQDLLLRSYFSTDGIEYSTCRVPIGGTDFSLEAYSYDDGEVDVELENFALVSADFDYKIPHIRKAIELSGNLELFASAWTAPKWMKTNGEYVGGFLKTEMNPVWANYFVKFLDAYEEQGISFWGITTGNEPNTAFLPVQINSVGWTPLTLANWVKTDLGPTLRASNHSNIKILYLDDQRIFLTLYVGNILVDPVLNQFVDGIAVHWYTDTVAPASLLTGTHALFPDKFLLYTEACNGKPVELGSWVKGENYADNILQDLQNWVGGWVDWNMVLDTSGGPTYIDNNVDSPIIVNATAEEFYKQPTYYTLGHFSKFIPRGSVRIDTHVDLLSSILLNVNAVAFQRPDNGTAVVLQNKNNYAVNVALVDPDQGTAQIKINPRSINTVLYW